MEFVVQSMSKDDHGNEMAAVSITVADRRGALVAAISWMEQGYTSVKIIGDGRIYTPGELALTFGKSDNPL